MIIFQAKELTKSFGVDTVLKDVSFTLQEGEKVGLVGPNGAGKTTLFRCLVGQETPDGGEISQSERLSLGYLQQIPDYPAGTTLFEAALDSFAEALSLREQMQELETKMAEADAEELEKTLAKYSLLTEEYERADGYSIETKIRRVVKGLGFSDEDLQREVNYFSGGEKTRVSLAKLLLKEPALLLLDEPTNHLDMAAMEWLEEFLKGYDGAMLLISHDRYFLDQVVNRIIELEKGKTSSFNGNYSRYLILKEEQILSQTRAYEKQQAEIQRTESYIERFRAGIKSKQARGRETRLNRLERLEGPNTKETVNFRTEVLKVAESGNVVLVGEGLSKAYDGKQLCRDINLTLKKGEKVALIGGNGVGKSTLLKIILGKVSPDGGQLQWGSRVKTAYYDQEHQDLNPTNRVIDELIYHFGLSEAEARNHLASMLFKGDDVFKQVKDLSGGEKGRLAFLKIFLTGANFLLLDEPTNHLDIDSKEVIEEFLGLYPGTILFISHDRYFVDLLADKVLELEEGKVSEYLGNYSYFKEKKAFLLKEAEEQEERQKVLRATPQPENRRRNATSVARNALKKIEKALAEVENRISLLEEDLDNVGKQLANSETYQDEEKAKELVAKYKKLEEDIALAYEEWEAWESQKTQNEELRP